VCAKEKNKKSKNHKPSRYPAAPLEIGFGFWIADPVQPNQVGFCQYLKTPSLCALGHLGTENRNHRSAETHFRFCDSVTQ
jgi:hypothetical protein